MDGHFEGNSIVIDLEIISLLADSVKKIIPVVIDTGCTGDLILTYTEAFPLALTLVGIQDYTIADGSKVSFFECLGIVKLGNKKVVSTISIRPSGSLLMGVSLMKKLSLNLSVNFVTNEVVLTDIKNNQTQNKTAIISSTNSSKKGKII